MVGLEVVRGWVGEMWTGKKKPLARVLEDAVRGEQLPQLRAAQKMSHPVPLVMARKDRLGGEQLEQLVTTPPLLT